MQNNKLKTHTLYITMITTVSVMPIFYTIYIYIQYNK